MFLDIHSDNSNILKQQLLKQKACYIPECSLLVDLIVLLLAAAVAAVVVCGAVVAVVYVV